VGLSGVAFYLLQAGDGLVPAFADAGELTEIFVGALLDFLTLLHDGKGHYRACCQELRAQ